MHHRSRDRHLLLHAGGKLVDLGVGEFAELEGLDQFFDSLAERRALQAVQFSKKREHFPGREPGIRTHIAREKSDLAPDRFGRPDNVGAAHFRRPLGRLQNGGKQAQTRGFARPVWSEQTENFACLYFESDVIQRVHSAALLVVKRLGEIIDADHTRRSAGTSRLALNPISNLPALDRSQPVTPLRVPADGGCGVRQCGRESPPPWRIRERLCSQSLVRPPRRPLPA